MKKIALYFILILSFTFCFTSCGGNDTNDCVNIYETDEFGKIFQNLTSATSDFSQNESVENCNKLKSAYTQYFNLLESFSDCADAFGTTQDWQNSLSEARQGIDNLGC